MTQRRSNETFRLTVSAMLLALMLVLGYVENLVPLPAPVPGVRLGLSNGVLIFAVYMLGIPTSYILMTMKVVLPGLLGFKNPVAVMIAFAGGLVSLTLMCILSRDKKISPVAVSAVGGVGHNIGQVAMVMLLMPSTDKLLFYLGVLILVGLACGLATGVSAASVMKHLKAARWQAGWKEKNQKAGAILVAVAAVVVVAGLCFAWRAMKRAAPAAEPPAEIVRETALPADGDVPPDGP